MVGVEHDAAGGSFYPGAPATRGSNRAGFDRPRGPRSAEEARRRRKQKYRRRRRIVLSTLLVVLLVVVYGLWSFFGALTTPGNQSFSAKWSDWLRAHHAAFIVNPLEQWYYSSKAPPKGGTVKGDKLNSLPTASKTTTPVKASVAHLASPSPVPLVVSPALPGEGKWQPVGPTVDGYPTMEVAQFRADNVYTSQITSAVWIDPLVTHIQSIPGSGEPGGTWSHPPHVTTAELPKALAAFNGGFRFADAQGGYYLDGHTQIPLRAGAASLVIYRDGRVNIGAWGTEVHMTPQVVSVLQNLVPMVDHGKITHDATYTDASIWGNTLGAATVVARSGVGVTADGALVYVAGPALSAKSLAESLQRAGAVRAMTLDINPEWVTFNFFSHLSPSHPSVITPASLYPQMQRPAYRYLPQAGAEDRDFFLVSQK